MRWLYLLSIIAVAGIAVAFYFWYQKKQAMEAETIAFGQDTVDAISAKWDPQALVSRAEPGLIAAMRSQGQSVDDLFHIYQQLGAPKNSTDCSFKDSAQILSSTQDYTSVSLVCKDTYEKGEATIDLTIRKKPQESDWRVYYIHINSAAFATQ